MAHSPEEIRKHVRFYIGIFGALLVLTVVTVLLSKIHFGAADSMTGNIIVGMVVAALKAGLVAAFFMHLSGEKPLIYRVLIFTVVFVIGLAALSLFAFHDDIPALF